MQRLELFTSGVKVPKLGSSLDYLARAFLKHKTNKEVSLAKLVAYSASVGAPENIAKEINQIWRQYLDQAYFLEDSAAAYQANMQLQYEHIKDMKLEATVDKSGLVVKIPKDL